jgi:hypothetical protein
LVVGIEAIPVPHFGVLKLLKGQIRQRLHSECLYNKEFFSDVPTYGIDTAPNMPAVSIGVKTPPNCYVAKK